MRRHLTLLNIKKRLGGKVGASVRPHRPGRPGRCEDPGIRDRRRTEAE